MFGSNWFWYFLKVPLVATLNTMQIWTYTMASGLHVKPCLAHITPRCFYCNTLKNGRPVVHLRLKRPQRNEQSVFIVDIADGQASGFDPGRSGQDSLIVGRKGAHLYAYSDICPHYGSTSLPWKRHQYLDASCKYIVCAAHGALFDIENGLCLLGACEGQSLEKIEVELLSSNEIWADLTTIKEFKSLTHV